MKILEKRSVGQRIVFAVAWLIFVTVAASYLCIFLWVFLSGLKTHDEIVLDPFGLRFAPQFQNYIDVFSMLRVGRSNFASMLFNSIYFSVFNALFTCLSSCMLAYVVSKFRYRVLKYIHVIVLIVITLPIYGSSGSMYKLYHDLGLLNSYTQVLAAFSGVNSYFLFFFAAFECLSWNYAEAAYIDGAGHTKVFFLVMFPQVFNVFGALFIMNWIACWNDYSSALIYLSTLPTLASGIYMFESNMIYEVRLDILYAAYAIAAVPPIVIFSLFSNMLTNNISFGALKD